MLTHDQLGKWGEVHAREYLLKLGYLIKDCNYTFNRMEIDIVCVDGQELVVVEVKTRNNNELGEPYLAVNRRKQRQIIRVANYYTKANHWKNEVRFDIISIVHNEQHTHLEHIRAAFSPGP
ncbi:MAG: hypothetical protein RLZZ301_767 [Bacteroidota bacterium]|jgi:putative endonuclease